MSLLYLRRGGRVEGPFDPLEARKRYAGGEWPRQTMSWRPGEKRWTSLAKRWPTGNNAGSMLLGFIATALIFVLAAALIGIPGRLFIYLPNALQTQRFLVEVVAGALGGAVVLTAFTTYRSWKRTRRLALHEALCILLTLMVGASSIALCRQAMKLVQTEDNFPNASIVYDDVARVIRVHGTIGHRFSQDLADALAGNGGAQAVVINSPGGLLDQAFKSVDVLIKAHLPLRIDGDCASACGLLWAGVPLREMTDASRIGLHQNRTVSDLPAEMTAATMKHLDEESIKLLASAGFTPAMLQRRAVTPPGSVYWLSAVDVMTAGIDAKVIGVDGRPVSVDTAKWAVIVAAWGKHSLTGQLYQAIALHEPALADTYKDKLYAALHGSNMPWFHYEDGLLETSAIKQAFAQVPDRALMDWAQSRQHDLADASQSGSASTCAFLTATATIETLDAITRRRVNDHALARTLALVNAIPGNALAQAVDVQPWAGEFSDYSRQLVTRLRQQGYPTDTAQWTSLQRCNYSSEFLLGAVQMPLASGAGIVRYSLVGRQAHR
ncbi:GYF domain-containing protein [Dyella mobilis]|uniref:GYF domain-containing protein n=1 Tax=Dyella mobilis TaxID=1849582 RepID=A0ABS2KMU3_9GAMM|nr:GYF domain-containing protein [Dyella mobilis]MBM7132208.1 hypothetical protein [Dyella mobilis]GLQ95806.1 hypothetical protein GCM10007863_02240 [Dyella mobilis]